MYFITVSIREHLIVEESVGVGAPTAGEPGTELQLLVFYIIQIVYPSSNDKKYQKRLN